MLSRPDKHRAYAGAKIAKKKLQEDCARGNSLDGVSSPQANPLRDRTVLLLRLGELLLGAERLVALFFLRNRKKKERAVSMCFFSQARRQNEHGMDALMGYHDSLLTGIVKCFFVPSGRG